MRMSVRAGLITAAVLAVVSLAFSLLGDAPALAQQGGLPSLPKAGGTAAPTGQAPGQTLPTQFAPPPPPAYATPAPQPAAQPSPQPSPAPSSAPSPQPSPAPSPQQAPAQAAASQFDVPADRPAREVYPAEVAKSGLHEIAGPVKPVPSPAAMGMWNRTAIDSAFGPVEAANESFAKIRVREIAAIAKLKAIDTGETVAGGVANAALAPIRGVGALLTSPVETLSNIPKGVGDFVARTGEGFKSDKSRFEDGMFAEIAGVSRKKREIAAEMGVDVYSSNQLLQAELDRVGRASAAGNITVDVGMIAVTGTAGAVIANLGRVDALQEIVNTQPASELRRRTRHTLEQMGMPSSFTDRFLDHPYYSPRRKTIVAGLLSPMKETRGKEKFLEAALTADSEAAALYWQQMLEIFSSYHFGVSPVAAFELVEGVPAAYSDVKGWFLAVPADRMYWTAEAQGPADKLLFALLGAKRAPVTLWTTGDITHAAAYELGRRGVQLGQQVGLNYN
jgi:hypothetical protein